MAVAVTFEMSITCRAHLPGHLGVGQVLPAGRAEHRGMGHHLVGLASGEVGSRCPRLLALAAHVLAGVLPSGPAPFGPALARRHRILGGGLRRVLRVAPDLGLEPRDAITQGIVVGPQGIVVGPERLVLGPERLDIRTQAIEQNPQSPVLGTELLARSGDLFVGPVWHMSNSSKLEDKSRALPRRVRAGHARFSKSLRSGGSET